MKKLLIGLGIMVTSCLAGAFIEGLNFLFFVFFVFGTLLMATCEGGKS